MFTLPIWVAVLYGSIMLLALFLVFLLSTIVDRQKHLIERQQFFIRILKGEGVTGPMFRPTQRCHSRDRTVRTRPRHPDREAGLEHRPGVAPASGTPVGTEDGGTHMTAIGA